MAPTPVLPVGAYRAPLRRRIRTRILPTRIAAAVLVVLCGVAWLTVLKLTWRPSLVGVAMGVAATGPLIFVQARWAQAVVSAVLWVTFASGAALALGATSNHRTGGVLLVLAAGVALLLLSRLGRRLRGRQPIVFVATVLALADIGFHTLVAAFLFDGELGDACLFFGGIALANAVGLFFLQRFETPWPHMVLNALVIVAVAADALNTKLFLLVALGLVAGLQIVAAWATTLPPMSPVARRRGATALRVVLWAIMVVSTMRGFWHLLP